LRAAESSGCAARCAERLCLSGPVPELPGGCASRSEAVQVKKSDLLGKARGLQHIRRHSRKILPAGNWEFGTVQLNES
jgi:hypothetical protein